MSDAYDEMAAGRGALRPHWRDLMGAVWAMQPGQLAERTARARAHLAEADEILGVFGEDDRRVTWTLDLLPIVIPEAEWTALAQGLAQRARLLDLALADLYGPQALIAERVLPPYLTLGNPEFLRPLRQAEGAAPRLQVYAADLVRMPDGGWRVFADRTQAPAGIGYALRHRNALARFFAEGFRTLPVRRHRPFVELWRASLQDLAPPARRGREPRVVLLTPGPYNESYFEHVYLARELGVTLVQGSDLTVRDQHVFLKTLDGLVPVDVIYRRVDGAWCDPLELRGESTLGVAGLVQAMRAGNVAVVNAPGSAAAETPALAPFLPALARQLLGEELKLPAVTTWWCGQRAALGQVTADLDRFFLRPVFAADPMPIEPATLPRAKRAALQAELAARPESFVAVERVAHGVAPTVTASGLGPQPFVLRTVVVRHGDDWTALPGGVARVLEQGSLYRGTLRHGGVAKDVWVLTGEEGDVVVPAVAREVPAIRRSTGVLPSRIADDLYWLGRHVERLDSAARLFRAAIARLVGGEMGPRELAELGVLGQALFRTGWIEAEVARSPSASRMFADGVARAAAQGKVMGSCLGQLRQLALSVRDRLSLDMWRNLNHLVGEVRAALADGIHDPDRLLDALDDLVRAAAAFGGLAAENMTRGTSWRFLDLGRRLERGIAISGTIGALLDQRPGLSELGLGLALEFCDSTITYRTRYGTEPRLVPALDLLLLDPTNPRALVFQLSRFLDHLRALAPPSGEFAEYDEAAQLMAQVSGFYFAAGYDPADATPVLNLLADVRGRLMALSELITRNYFSHVAPMREGAGLHAGEREPA
jgi:uncharacterized circularly permuted ATP-grasp superfamily protein/uncharacterized alpha-E superfamily protein